jgi:hypothetical protein
VVKKRVDKENQMSGVRKALEERVAELLAKHPKADKRELLRLATAEMAEKLFDEIDRIRQGGLEKAKQRKRVVKRRRRV